MTEVSGKIEELNNSVVFTTHKSLKYEERCKDDAGYGCILPNEEYRQNKYAYFYMPKVCKKNVPKSPFGIDRPVVAFKPLHPSDGGLMKEGATLADLLCFVSYLFKEKDQGFTRSISKNSQDLEEACKMMSEIGIHFPIQTAITDLMNRENPSPLLNFVRLEKNETELYLVMQFGSKQYQGFLYGTLLTFVNMLVHKTRQRASGVNGELQNESTIQLSKIENILDKVLESLKGHHTKIKAPFEAPYNLKKYESDQQLFPQAALNYLIDKKYLSQGATEKLGAYRKFLSDGTRKEEWVKASIGPIGPSGEVIISYFKGGKKKAFGTVTLKNVPMAVATGEIEFDLSAYKIKEDPIQLQLTVPVVADKKGVKLAPLVLIARREKDNDLFRVITKGYKIEFVMARLSDQIKPTIISMPIAMNLRWEKTKIEVLKCEMIITPLKGKNKTPVKVTGTLDKKRSIYSEILKRHLVKVFQYPMFITSDETKQRPGVVNMLVDSGKDVSGLVTISTYTTQHAEVQVDDDTIDATSLLHLYVRSKAKNKEAKLFDLYHGFRRLLAEQSREGKVMQDVKDQWD